MGEGESISMENCCDRVQSYPDAKSYLGDVSFMSLSSQQLEELREVLVFSPVGPTLLRDCHVEMCTQPAPIQETRSSREGHSQGH